MILEKFESKAYFFITLGNLKYKYKLGTKGLGISRKEAT